MHQVETMPFSHSLHGAACIDGQIERYTDPPKRGAPQALRPCSILSPLCGLIAQHWNGRSIHCI